MTNEKAIEMIHGDMELNGHAWTNEETEAVKLAIEALEQYSSKTDIIKKISERVLACAEILLELVAELEKY